MTYLTLGQAARETGKHKTTIARAIEDGRLSARHNEHGHYQIDPAELFRVFDPVPRDADGDPGGVAARPSTQPHEIPSGDAVTDAVTLHLLQDLEHTKQELQETREELEEKERRLVELREAMAALPSPAQHAAEIERLKREQGTALEQQKRRALKLFAKQKQRAEAEAERRHAEWQQAIAERQAEVDAARQEAQRQREQLESSVAKERAQREALEARGFLARLFNRKPMIELG